MLAFALLQTADAPKLVTELPPLVNGLLVRKISNETPLLRIVVREQ